MNAKRLLKLADFLETVPRRRFNMSIWADGAFCGKPNEQGHPDCKTAACAMGWACTMPAFKRLGLRQEYDECFGDYDVILCQDGKVVAADGLSAAMALFDIRDSAAHLLFLPDGTPGADTPKAVAKRIRKFVKENEALP